MGAKPAASSRIRPEDASADSGRRSRGGQYSLGLFGCTKSRHQRPVAQSVEQRQARHETAQEAVLQLARLHGGSRVEQQPVAIVREARPAQAESFVEYDAASRAPLCLFLRRGGFEAMIRLDEYDQRPALEVLAEWLGQCRTLMGGDAKRADDPLGDCPPARLSNAMRLAQIHADERELYGLTCEEAYEAHCSMGAGYAETLMAIEG